MSAVSEKVFRGSLQECVQYLGRCYLAQTPKHSHRSTEARASIARFCGVNDGTVVRWIRDGSHLPGGETRLRLMCYLDLIGFSVIELEGLKIRKGFAELIGYGLLTPSLAAKIIGYATEHQLFRVLRPAEGISEGKKRLIFDAWRARREELEQKKESSKAEYPLGFPLSTEKVDKTAVEDENVLPPVLPVNTDNSFHHATKSLIFALAKLLQQPQIDGLLPDEARRLYFPSRRTILELSSRLCALSSKLIEEGKGDQQDEEPNGMS